MNASRFAPSPTGLLHLGHAFSARLAFDLASLAGGRFLLRFEDIDRTRVRQPFYAAIIEDLEWLGIRWDAPPLSQLERLDAYEAALERLKLLGAVYPCFCTRREIEVEIAAMASAPQGPEGPLYPGTCRGLDDSARAARLATGQVPAWRLDAEIAASLTGPLDFTDQKAGTILVDPLLLGDVVLARKDIATSYHLAVVIDDAHQQISHVTRGEDLLSSTHVHRTLQQLLGFPTPHYFHHPLITDETGRRLAKRDDARSIRSWRESCRTAGELLARFDIGSVLADCHPTDSVK